jgi:phospholipid/cholesterol/gamma-HCH transport system substrate-binding protein
MKISKEVRIGILVTLAILIFFIGFNFLKNASFFSKENEYYCYYTNVDGLLNSANVQVSGLNVGHVTAMELIPGKGVKVTITIGKKIHLPVGTVASLKSIDLLGTKAIMLDLGQENATLPNKSELISNREGGLVDNVSAELTPRLQELKGTIVAFDTALAGVNALVGSQNQREISEALHSINNAAKSMEQLTASLNRESVEVSAVLHNARSITANLESQNDTIKHILANASKITRQLGNAPIQQTVTELQSAVSQMKDIMGKINRKEGTLGLLVNDREAYDNLNHALNSLNALMKDINAHPSRYINVTVFGSGKKKN